MALSNYALCSVCENKAFYDANITDPRYTGYDEWTGKHLDEDEMCTVEVLCTECSKEYAIHIYRKSL